MDALEEMARYCFGYGRWEAPIWFIGLEEGMSGTLEDRIRAWQRLGKENGLSDCRDFHEAICDRKYHGEGAILQKTWRVLCLIILAYRGLAHDIEDLREYQSTRLGQKEHETALIELFGLPARNVLEGAAQRKVHFSEDVIDNIHFQRIATVHKKLQSHKPDLVVMYGAAQKPKEHFERLAGRSLEKWDIFQKGESLMTLTPHPTSHGVPDKTWIEHAEKLRTWTPKP